MKKKILAVLLSIFTLFNISTLTACEEGEGIFSGLLEDVVGNIELEENNRVLNEVLDLMAECIADNTAIVISDKTFEGNVEIAQDPTKVYFYNDCSFKAGFKAKNKYSNTIFIQCQFENSEEELRNILNFTIVKFVDCVCGVEITTEGTVTSSPVTLTKSAILNNLEINVEGAGDAVAVVSEAIVQIKGGVYNGGKTPFGSAGNTSVWCNHEDATIIIEDGYFYIEGLAVNEEGVRDTGHIDLIYCSLGKIEIRGGFFEGANSEVWLLNCKDSNYNEGKASIIVTGGTFVNFNPANCISEGDNTSFVAEGYKVEREVQDNGDVWYTVTLA